MVTSNLSLYITAFEPFGPHLTNSSQLVLEQLKKLQNFSSKLLPVTIKNSFELLLQDNDFCNANLVIHLGLASSRSKISLELMAYNSLNFKIPDNDGLFIHNEVISVDYPPIVQTGLSFDWLSPTEQVEFSHDPGRYICNYIYFRSLCFHQHRNVLFIHLPDIHDNQELLSITHQTYGIIMQLWEEL